MIRRWLKRLSLALAALCVLGYAAIALWVSSYDRPVAAAAGEPTSIRTVAIFGASGTAGDGILKAALASPAIDTIHVITRRETPRMRAGVADGKIVMTLHQDYLDYGAIRGRLTEVDAVFWAIGLSSIGIDEATYRRIHVEFPRRFVAEWLESGGREQLSFHYISSSDISADSRAMWARVKVEAENTLFELAEGTRLRVIAYRPDYIGPTPEEAHMGQRLLYGFFAPLGVAVKAEQIGRAMIELASRGGDEFGNGTTVGTLGIRRYSDAYGLREFGQP